MEPFISSLIEVCSSAMCIEIAILAITALVTKIATGRRSTSDLASNRPPPPVVNCFALLLSPRTLAYSQQNWCANHDS
uniref:Uncharacterized protein n=1 Tax=Leersia perrieri TaxID=77586 RepID=A0A0D9WGJ4_9ORYZ